MLFQTILVVISSLLLFSIVSGKVQKTLRKVPQLARFFSTSSTPVQGNVSSATSTNLQKKASDYFKEKDENKLFDLIEKYSFGILIMTNDDGTIQISHVPMYLDRKTRTLNGHLANHNPMYSLISQGKPITIVFEGPHSYISPTFMADKYNRVPTWNYCYAHVHGTSELISAEELPQGLALLGRKYEGDSENAWKMKEMDLKILKPKFHKIFGIRVKIDRVEGNFKFTADAEEDKAGILKGLRDRNEDYDRSLADLMAKAWDTETKTE